MSAAQSKKLLILNILDILKRRTDADHRLSQQDIIRILKSDYNMEADRKAIKRNLMDLVECGFQLEYREIVRKGKFGEEETIQTAWYLEHDFTRAELLLLIDSLLFSRHIPPNHRWRLISKLEGLSSVYFKPRVRHIHSLAESQPSGSELFLTIEVLDEAISHQRQVSFVYTAFDIDKKPHPRKGKDGKDIEYLVNPYRMAATNGRYYLIGNLDRHDNAINFRLDRIAGIRLLDTPSKPMRDVKGFENGLDLPKHMAEHIYMFSGESTQVTFRAKRYLINDIMDWFGREIIFSDVTDDEVTAKVNVNAEAMKRWALQYALHVKILSPSAMAKEIRQNLETALAKYREASEGQGQDGQTEG